jgi:hypothetical protein
MHVDRFGLNSDAQNAADQDDLDTLIDEMAMMELVKKQSLLDTVEWSNTEQTHAVIYEGVISPFTGKSTRLETLLHVLSRPFHLWSGTLVFDIEVVCSQFHRGQLVFETAYGKGSAVWDMGTTYATYMSIENGVSRFRVEVPFVSNAPARSVNYAGLDWEEHGIGHWRVAVVNALRGPTDVSNKCDVNIYISGGEDFCFHYMAGYAGDVYVPVVSVGDSSYDADTTDDPVAGSKVKTESSVVGVPSKSRPQASLMWGEQVQSVTDPLRRYTYFARYLLDNTKVTGPVTTNEIKSNQKMWDGRTVDVSDVIEGVVSYPTSTIFTEWALWSSLFKQWKGSLRFLIVASFATNQRHQHVINGTLPGTFEVQTDIEETLDSGVVRVFYVPQTSRTTADAVKVLLENRIAFSGDYLSTIGAINMGLISKQAPQLEFEIPYVDYRKTGIVRRHAWKDATSTYVYDMGGAHSSGFLYFVNETWWSKTEVTIFVGASNDFRFSNYAGYPAFDNKKPNVYGKL